MAEFIVAPVDQNTLLTVSNLRLSADLAVRTIRPERVAIKYLPAGTHLVATPEQWRILERFRDGANAPQVLCDLITERLCPPLREYYELVVKAARAGVLQTVGWPQPEAQAAAEWRTRLGGPMARFFALVCMGVSTLLLLLNPPPLPGHAGHLLAGWLGLCLAQSAGAFLAACVLRGGDAEVYEPRLVKRTWLPRFAISRRDAVMLGREGEVNLALAQVAPFFLLSALAALFWPELTLPLVCGLLYHLSPFHRGALVDLLVALHRDPRLATTHDFLFTPNQAFTVLWRSRLKFADRRFSLMMAGYTLLWLLLVFVAGCALLRLNAVELLHRFTEAGGFQFTALFLLVALGAATLWAAGLAAWILAQQAREALEPWRRRRVARRTRRDASPEAVRECMARTHLFNGLPAEDIARLAEVAGVVEAVKGGLVVRQGEAGDALYVILSGVAEVLREQSVGRPERIAELMPDDVFGEMALMGDGVRTRTVRAVSPLVLLTISRADFQRLVLGRLSREQITNAVQKLAFLARAPLSRQWSPQATAAFARRSQFLAFEAGVRLITRGEPNQFFYLVHEGTLEVAIGGRPVARLGAGDFFGEISLLQNSVASADIQTLSPGRCLVLSRRDFLEFIARDFMVGLHFEEIGSKRLGHPLFPLGRACFEDSR